MSEARAAHSGQTSLLWDHKSDRRERQTRDLVRWLMSTAAFHATMAQIGNPHSLATCEKVPTSGRATLVEADIPRAAEGSEVSPAKLARDIVGDEPGGDLGVALEAAVGRDRQRQAKVVELIRQHEVAHAKRLATCGRQSVELKCAGWDGCGTRNYVPISCDSPLCADCAKQRQGRAIGRYRERIESWDNPTVLRVSHPARVEPEAGAVTEALEELREAFGRLRRRVIQPSGEHQGKRWVWSFADDGGEPADHYWRSSLVRSLGRGEVARLESEYVRPALHSVDECSECHTRRVRCQGVGREGHSVEECSECYTRRVRCEYAGDCTQGIPLDELLREGLYGIDIKQRDGGTLYLHLHILADVPYLPQAALAKVWDELMGAPVVDVRRVKSGPGTDREDALAETIGYAAKPPEYENVEAEVAMFRAIKGAKMVQPFGDLHGNTPKEGGLLECGGCGRTPSVEWDVEWAYEGVIDGRFSGSFEGSAPDGDRPPDR